jgi:hypothetical protein
MAYATTTNELSISHGHSPIVKRQKTNEFRRGFFVYITDFDRNLGYDYSINSRIGYYDYDCNCSISGIDKLVELVIKEGRSGQLKTHITSSTKSFPLLRTNLGQIDFGWDACDVCYILDIPGWSFQPLQADTNPSEINQPVVFRKNKVINKTSSEYKIDSYLSNKCFYNLKVENNFDASIVKFSNFMLDESGIKITYSSNDTREWHYCMDMYIRIEQNVFNIKKIFSVFDRSELVDELIDKLDEIVNSVQNKEHIIESSDAAYSARYQSPSVVVDSPENLPEFLTIVFDPPNCNGGGSGPPKLN